MPRRRNDARCWDALAARGRALFGREPLADARQLTIFGRSRPTFVRHRAWVVSAFGANSQQAHDFGFPPPKTRVVSPETKVLAAAKLRATRAARHTMGKRQKAVIKGVVEQVFVSADGSVVSSEPANEVTVKNGGGGT